MSLVPLPPPLGEPLPVWVEKISRLPTATRQYPRRHCSRRWGSDLCDVTRKWQSGEQFPQAPGKGTGQGTQRPPGLAWPWEGHFLYNLVASGNGLCVLVPSCAGSKCLLRAGLLPPWASLSK